MMAKPEKRSELGGVGLLVLAVFMLLCILPVGALGGLGAAWFPSGNVMGPLGSIIRRGAVGVLGVAAGLLPVLIALGGLALAGWIDRSRAIRFGVLGGGLLLLLSSAAEVVPPFRGGAGWLGGVLGGLLSGLVGPFGAAFILGALFVLLSLATLGWNPLVRPSQWAWRGIGAGWRSAVDWLEGRRFSATDDGGVLEDVSRASDPTEALEPIATSFGEEVSPPVEPSAKRRSAPAGVVGSIPREEDGGVPAGGELPPLDLLTAPAEEHLGEMHRDLDTLGEVLVEKLRSFGVESELGGRTTGPVVTQFEVVPAPGVKVNRIANLDRDLALAMRARTVRIVAPIPGKGAVGVEIPNPLSVTVQLREILESRAFRESRADLPLALGKDLHGAPYVADLTKMPHCLIAGATGSGKSVCLNTIITSLVYRHTPETLRLLLIDPKMVELSTYADLPHLRYPVVTDPHDAAKVLKWGTIEMERRYALLSENGVRSIGEFNRRVRSGATLRRVQPVGEEGDPDRWVYDGGVLPYVVLVVDELADLMMTVQSEVEKPLTLLAQKARAVGIHLLVATQRPSVNVVTGLIKANFPCRIAFRVASKTDSRTILDQNGADSLLGHGDMLFLPPGHSSPIRLQGAFISTEETQRLLDWYRTRRDERLAEAEGAEVEGEEDILEVVRTAEAEDAGGDADFFGGEWDELFRDAAGVCIGSAQGSTSLLQRKLRIGYGRAARIVDQLEEAGVLGPPDGSKPREVLMGLEQFERMMSGTEG